MGFTSLQFIQAVAVVQHGERADRTFTELTLTDKAERIDPPLSAAGKKKSRVTGGRLVSLTPDGASPYQLIISSPELRCAQTASEIAQELDLPVLFDRDLVDAVHGLGGGSSRSPQNLLDALHEDHPTVRYAVDWDARLQILGGASAGVVAMPQAMSRYHFKAELIIDAAFAQAMSVVIVCNGMTALAMAHYMK